LSVSESRLSQPTHYAIHIKERIPSRWSMWFEGLAIADLEDGGSILSGPVTDQSALHGLLAKVRDLNLTLISVVRTEPPPTKTDPRDHELQEIKKDP
jgi:hypothetical protein